MPITVNAPDYLEKKRLPKDEGTQIMGIIAICLPGIVGIVLAIIVISQANHALRIYRLNPNDYFDSSLKKIKTGKTCAIISILILVVGMILLMGMILLYAISHNPPT